MILMRELIIKHINGKKVLVLFIITNIVYVFMLAVTIPNVKQYSGGMDLPDMMPGGYSSDYIITLFNKLGEAGRDTYLYRQIPVDMIYPLLFAVSYTLLLGYVLNKLGKVNSMLFYLCFLPVFSGLFDYLENIGIIFMLKSYPDVSTGLIQVTSIFSVCKNVSTTIFFVTLIVLLVNLALFRIRRK
jgi:hypothetical protein